MIVLRGGRHIIHGVDIEFPHLSVCMYQGKDTEVVHM